MDRFEAMTVVLAVAEGGSLSEASRRLKSPLPTVSRKVAELEAQLQTKLFNRTSRALVLTDAGRSYIAAAKRILADVAEAERAAAGEYTTPRGDLVLSSAVTMGRVVLLPVVGDFLKEFPLVDVQLDLQDRAVNLLEEHVDAALRIGILADSNLIAIRLGEIRRVACASPAYLKARGVPKSPADLKDHDGITYAPLMSAKKWTFIGDSSEIAAPVHCRLQVGNLETACDAARAGMGITIALSYSIASSLKDGTLTTVLDAWQPPPIPVSLVYASGRFMPIKLRAFLDFAVPRLKKALADVPASKRRAAK
jgi:DNA-binding transcriptional LysR family regulator